MTVGKKLFVCFSGSLIIGLALSIVGCLALTSLGRMQDELLKVDIVQMNLSHRVNLGAEQLRSFERGFILYALKKDQAAMDRNRQAFLETRAELDKAFVALKPLVDSDSEVRAFQSARDAFQKWPPVFDEIVSLCNSGDALAAQRLAEEKTVPLAVTMDSAGDQLIEGASRSVAEKDQASEAIRARDLAIMIAASIMLLLTVSAGLWLVRQINRSLRGAVSQLNQRAGQVASAASQLASSSQSLAQGASEQAASLEETSASSEEIRTMAAQSSAGSREAAQLVTDSQQRIVETDQSLGHMVSAIDDINTHSGNISRIIKVIDEISFQTNILALNAAVEAARAGEAGMGFAVVADEVRNLAQRCAQAARDTAALIEESITKSSQGKTKVDQVAAAIRQITEFSSRVKLLVDQVSNSSDDQSRGIEQVARAVMHMEQVTQTTAASAEQTAATAQELTRQADALRTVIQDLTTLVGAAG